MKRFIPTNIWVTRSEIEPYQHGSWYNVSNLVKSNHETKYTVFENNPEYYIIPKGDVEKDLMKTVYDLESFINTLVIYADEKPTHQIGDKKAVVVPVDVIYFAEAYLEKLRKCFISQSDMLKNKDNFNTLSKNVKETDNSLNDMVTIPRMLAESALECMQAYDSVEWNDGFEGDNYSETIYELEELLNYKAVD